MKQKTIAVVMCYMGKLPWFFDYFAHSCSYNLSVDFFVIIDDTTYVKPLPNNLKLIYKTLEEISIIATQKVGFKIDIKNSYKLCDFKPAYGILFSDIIEDYDFWGQGDIDVIFGNIRNFITDDILESFDSISVRHDYLPGCFFLFKNNLKMNNLFRLSKDYEKVFTSDDHYCFDETNFQHQAFTEGKPFHEISSEIESMTHVVRKMEDQNYLKAYFDFHVIEGCPGRMIWEKGRLVYMNKYEAILYHLIFFKKAYKPLKEIKMIPEAFTISPTRIYHLK